MDLIRSRSASPVASAVVRHCTRLLYPSGAMAFKDHITRKLMGVRPEAVLPKKETRSSLLKTAVDVFVLET